MITAICPGSYDPVTMGHVDVISRAASIFDRVVVGVVASPRHKTPLFSLEDRVEFLNEAVGDLDNVEVAQVIVTELSAERSEQSGLRDQEQLRRVLALGEALRFIDHAAKPAPLELLSMAFTAIIQGVRAAGRRGVRPPAAIAEQQPLGDVGFGIDEILRLRQPSSTLRA